MENSIQIIRDFFNEYIPEMEIDDEENIFDLGVVNSLFALQVVLFVEKTFELEMDEDDLDFDNFKSVNSINDFIEKKRKKAV